MLRALRKLLRPNGRSAFLTIALAEGLEPAARRRGRRDGPPAPASTRPLDVLMEAAGYSDVMVEDVTDGFLATCTAWHEAALSNEEALRDHLGSQAFDELDHDRRAMIGAIQDGLLVRYLITARVE